MIEKQMNLLFSLVRPPKAANSHALQGVVGITTNYPQPALAGFNRRSG
jgi:hypothetical protein